MRKLKIFIAVLLVVPFLFSFLKMDDVLIFNKTNFQNIPDTLSWRLLGRIKFITKPDKEYGQIEWPVVNNELKLVHGKQIVMSGFVVPIDNESYALSKNVFASCFFCGKAGPETIMGIKFRDKTKRYKTDTYLTLKGNFRVNTKNVTDWIYHIEDAVVVGRK